MIRKLYKIYITLKESTLYMPKTVENKDSACYVNFIKLGRANLVEIAIGKIFIKKPNIRVCQLLYA